MAFYRWSQIRIDIDQNYHTYRVLRHLLDKRTFVQNLKPQKSLHNKHLASVPALITDQKLALYGGSIDSK